MPNHQNYIEQISAKAGGGGGGALSWEGMVKDVQDSYICSIPNKKER